MASASFQASENQHSMKRKIIIGLLALSTSLFAEPATLTPDDRAALEVGRAILAVDRALEYKLPEVPSPEERAKADQLTKEMIRAGGSSPSLYFWVSGRLQFEISIDKQFLIDTPPDSARAGQLNARMAYLQRVKLAIDAPR